MIKNFIFITLFTFTISVSVLANENISLESEETSLNVTNFNSNDNISSNFDNDSLLSPTTTNNSFDFIDNPSIFINNELLVVKNKVINLNGRIFYPMREVSYNLGATVTWDYSSKTAMATLYDNSVSFPIDEDYYLHNDSRIPYKNNTDRPFIYDDLTYVPIRYLSESLGFLVTWDDVAKTVSILSTQHLVDTLTVLNLQKISDTYILKYYLQNLDTINVILDFAVSSNLESEKLLYANAAIDYITLLNEDTLKPSDDFLIYYYAFIELINNISNLCVDSIVQNNYDGLVKANNMLNDILLLDIISEILETEVF